MIYILNIETSTKVCGVSISKDGVLVDSVESKEGNYSHSEKLAPFIEEIMQRNNIEYSELSAIAISKGPGSYTGLRIGTSTAKGLCFSLDIPLIAISTLESMAAYAQRKMAANYKGYYRPMIDARRMEVYSQQFDDSLNSQDDVRAIIVDENTFEEELKMHKIAFFGDGADKCKEVITHENAIFIDDSEASAVGMIALSYSAFLKKDFVDVAYFEPFYLKEFVAAVSRVKGLR
jgi:tRNA threonylcarbamoyladenosine biosynthesis protein TsaB